MATELDLYSKIRVLCEDSTDANRYQELNGFAIGDRAALNANNLEIDSSNTTYFYSQKWTDAGAAVEDFEVDFPLCYLLPPISRKSTFGHTDFDLVFYVLDVFGHNNDGTRTAADGGRSKEAIWKDTATLAKYLRNGLHDPATYYVQGRELEISRLQDMENKRLYGVECRVTVRLKDDC